MSLSKRCAAEFFGTFWLVFGGCGSAVLAASFPTGEPGAGHLGIGFLGVAFAFGLTLLTMAFTIGPISGCHSSTSRVLTIPSILPTARLLLSMGRTPGPSGQTLL